jgi:hypothetical protein
MKDNEDIQVDQPDDSENTIAGWMNAIAASGKERREKEEELRRKLLARKHFVIKEEEDTEMFFETWLWRGEGNVVTATVRAGIIDIYSIQHYPFDFINKLAEVAKSAY